MAEEAPKTTPETPPEAEHQPPEAEQKPPEAEQQPPESSDLMTSAKTLAEAAQAAASHQTDKIDKDKVAAAAEDVLDAVMSSGKLDEKEGVGQYLGKAQDYLHQMHTGDAGDKKEEKEDGGGGVMNIAKGLTGFFK